MIASVLGNLVGLVALYSFFTILFTKKIPRGLFDLGLNAIRWQARSNLYGAFMATQYPPFEWEPEQPSASRAAPTEIQPAADPPPPPAGT
jgi:hypothetical protein